MVISKHPKDQDEMSQNKLEGGDQILEINI